MAAESPEILVNDGGIQEGEKTDGEVSVKSTPVGVEVVQVIFKANPFRVQVLGIEQAGDQAAALLFGGKSFGEQIDAGPNEPGTSFLVIQNGVGFAGIRFWPMNGAAVEMARMQERHCPFFRLQTKEVFQPEVHHRPG